MLDVTWAQPEPSSGRLDTRAIYSALGTVPAWNTAHSTSRLDIKLRTGPGGQAPLWAKPVGGAPFALTAAKRDVTTGRFWVHGFRAA